MKSLMIIIVFLSFYSTSILAAQEDATIDNFLKDTKKIVLHPETRGTECAQVINGLMLKYRAYHGDQFNTPKTYAYARDYLNRSFEIRLLIRERLRMYLDNDPQILENKSLFQNDGPETCIYAVKNLFKALRYFEDYMIEILERRKHSTYFDYVNLEATEASYFQINPQYKDFKSYRDLQSGDALLVRGDSYTSAAIAHSTLAETQLSHLAFVYVSPAKETSTMEAEAAGLKIYSLKEHLNLRYVRTVVYRYRDTALAKKAAEVAYNDAQKFYQENGYRIPYDFRFDYQDSSHMFCSEVIYYGFKIASKGKVDVPCFKSTFIPGLREYLRKAGIPLTEENIKTYRTFAPGDIEFDPRFELVAEWRNPKRTADSRTKDIIFRKIFSWIGNDHYQFHPSVLLWLGTQLVWAALRTPVIKYKLLDKLPRQMRPIQMQQFGIAEIAGKVIQKQLQKVERKYSFPIIPQEAERELEKMRQNDYQRWLDFEGYLSKISQMKGGEVLKVKRPPPPVFHGFLHP
jgi:hypothetical protein